MCNYLGLYIIVLFSYYNMEQLPADLQEQLKKSSTERLRLRLCQTAGAEVDVVAQMERVEVTEALVKSLLEQQQCDKPAEVKSNNEIKLRELALEEKRIDVETRRLEIEVHEKAAEREMEIKRMEMELEMKKN